MGFLQSSSPGLMMLSAKLDQWKWERTWCIHGAVLGGVRFGFASACKRGIPNSNRNLRATFPRPLKRKAAFRDVLHVWPRVSCFGEPCRGKLHSQVARFPSTLGAWVYQFGVASVVQCCSCIALPTCAPKAG